MDQIEGEAVVIVDQRDVGHFVPVRARCRLRRFDRPIGRAAPLGNSRGGSRPAAKTASSGRTSRIIMISASDWRVSRPTRRPSRVDHAHHRRPRRAGSGPRRSAPARRCVAASWRTKGATGAPASEIRRASNDIGARQQAAQPAGRSRRPGNSSCEVASRISTASRTLAARSIVAMRVSMASPGLEAARRLDHRRHLRLAGGGDIDEDGDEEQQRIAEKSQEAEQERRSPGRSARRCGSPWPGRATWRARRAAPGRRPWGRPGSY